MTECQPCLCPAWFQFGSVHSGRVWSIINRTFRQCWPFTAGPSSIMRRKWAKSHSTFKTITLSNVNSELLCVPLFRVMVKKVNKIDLKKKQTNPEPSEAVIENEQHSVCEHVTWLTVWMVFTFSLLLTAFLLWRWLSMLSSPQPSLPQCHVTSRLQKLSLLPLSNPPLCPNLLLYNFTCCRPLPPSH